MEPLVIDLPPELRDFVTSETAAAGLSRPGDFVLRLIEEAVERKWVEEMERLAEEGIASGPPIPWKPGDYDEMRRRLLESMASRVSHAFGSRPAPARARAGRRAC